MEKSRNYVVFGVLALVVSLVAVSLAYAGFSQTLNINGNATVKAVSWNVHFTNVANVVPSDNSVTVTTQPGTKGPLTIGDYSVQFTTPGTYATLTFDVENTGNFAALWDGLSIGNLSCTGGSGESNANAVCGNMTYELYTGSDATVVANKVTAADSATLAANGGYRTFTLKLTYVANDDPSILPSGSDVAVTIGTTSLTFSQSGNAVLVP